MHVPCTDRQRQSVLLITCSLQKVTLYTRSYNKRVYYIFEFGLGGLSCAGDTTVHFPECGSPSTRRGGQSAVITVQLVLHNAAGTLQYAGQTGLLTHLSARKYRRNVIIYNSVCHRYHVDSLRL